jgi:hypothetical protein
MNQHMKLFGSLKAGLAVVLLAAVAPVTAAPGDAPLTTVQQVPRSVFTIPANSKEGRDPFFPNSLRPYQALDVPGSHPTTDLSSLVMQGILGAPPHQLVIINNITFGVGDDAEVRTPQGRIRIHCVDISGDSVVIEANGQEQTLHYGNKP